MRIKQKMEEVISFFKTYKGRICIKRASLFIIILLGLRWAIATGTREGTKEGLWNIERNLHDINEEILGLHRTLIIISASDKENIKERMLLRLIEFPQK